MGGMEEVAVFHPEKHGLSVALLNLVGGNDRCNLQGGESDAFSENTRWSGRFFYETDAELADSFSE